MRSRPKTGALRIRTRSPSRVEDSRDEEATVGLQGRLPVAWASARVPQLPNVGGASARRSGSSSSTVQPSYRPTVTPPHPHTVPPLRLFGTDYPTPDGTCVRDYIHVTDLANAHILGLEFLLAEDRSEQFNLGNGHGYSVRDVVDTAAAVTGCPIAHEEAPRRPGDPPSLIGSAEKAREILGWVPEYPDLETIVRHAWEWERKGKANH